MEAVILFSILIITIALSIPIGITLGISTALAMYFTSDIPLLMLAQKSVTGLDSFPLLAIPFFILAGALMCGGGSEDPEVFSYDLFNTRRLVVAPLVILAGIIVEIVAIMKKPKK